MILKKMHIEKFRNLEKIDIVFGKYITVVAGRNGTAKTSLLGLVAQPFTYRIDKIPQAYTIFGMEFQTEFSDIHKVAEKDMLESNYDVYVTDLYNEHDDMFDTEKLVKLPLIGRPRKGKNEKKEKTRLVVERGRTKGKGNYFYPVIYLGLKRLFPLGEHKDKEIQTKGEILSGEEAEFYEKVYQKIFTSKEQIISTEIINTPYKHFAGAQFEKYDSKSFSAGQDNLGQIIGAILSFRRLKNEKKNEYHGGIICIDEIESTFHPSALENVIKWLYEQAKDLKLQLILSTHSLSVVEMFFSGPYKKDSSLIYLESQKNSVTVKTEVNLREIESDMTLKSIPKEFLIICEDKEATQFLSCIIKSELKNKVQIISAVKGSKELEQIADSVFAELYPYIILYDGDVSLKKTIDKDNEHTLPGCTRPEDILYLFMRNNWDRDDFWINNIKPEIYFNPFMEQPEDRKEAKNFFEHVQKQNPDMICHAYTTWSKENHEIVEKFNQVLREKFDTITKKHRKKK